MINKIPKCGELIQKCGELIQAKPTKPIISGVSRDFFSYRIYKIYKTEKPRLFGRVFGIEKRLPLCAKR